MACPFDTWRISNWMNLRKRNIEFARATTTKITFEMFRGRTRRSNCVFEFFSMFREKRAIRCVSVFMFGIHSIDNRYISNRFVCIESEEKLPIPKSIVFHFLAFQFFSCVSFSWDDSLAWVDRDACVMKFSRSIFESAVLLHSHSIFLRAHTLTHSHNTRGILPVLYGLSQRLNSRMWIERNKKSYEIHQYTHVIHTKRRSEMYDRRRQRSLDLYLCTNTNTLMLAFDAHKHASTVEKIWSREPTFTMRMPLPPPLCSALALCTLLCVY